jgi:acyl-coenzyme A thioesterase PaaI-like protein
MASDRDRLIALWQRLAPLPGGDRLFSRVFAWFVPYSGTVGAVVRQLEPGYCRVTAVDRSSLRNHLSSIHAVALVNLGEMTSGLAMTMALPANVRGIVTEIGGSFAKKARGDLVAESRVSVPTVGEEPVDTRVETVITNRTGETVAVIHTIWRLAHVSAPSGS